MIISFLFVLSFIAVFAFSLYLLRIARVSLLSISILSIFYIAYVVYAYLGILPLYFFLDAYRYTSGVNDRNIILKLFVLSGLCLCLVILGWIFVRNILKDYAPVRAFSGKETVAGMSIPGLIGCLAIGLLCLGVLYLYISQLSDVALFAAIRRSGDVGAIRSHMTNAFAGKYHWYKVFLSDVLNLTAFILFANALFRKKMIHYGIALMFILFALFTASMSAQKGPAAWLLVGLFFVYCFVKYNGRINFKKLFLFGVCTVLPLLIFSYIYFMGVRTPFLALGSILSRVLTGQITPAYFYLRIFPVEMDFLWGASFPNPGGILPYTPISLAKLVYEIVHPMIYEQRGIVGSMPTVFWGEMYANFGILGAASSAYIFGSFLYIIHYLVSKLPRHPITIGFLTWLILHLKSASGTALSGYFFDSYLFVILLITLVLLLIDHRGKLSFCRVSGEQLRL